jgi:hypothetical protein
MEIDKYYTYQLIDPFTDDPFYVGKGCGNRMYKHENDVKNSHIPNKTNFDLYNKIKSILSKNSSVKYEKIKENISETEALALEAAFINFYGLNNLCNYLMSWCGSMYRSEKTRKRQSEANRGSNSYMFGKPKTKEQKLKNKIAHMGIKNANFDHSLYKFYNEKLNIKKCCTQYELRKKYNLDSGGLYRLITKKQSSIRGWTLGKTLKEIEDLRRKRISFSNRGKLKSELHRKNLWKNRKKHG